MVDMSIHLAPAKSPVTREEKCWNNVFYKNNETYIPMYGKGAITSISIKR